MKGIVVNYIREKGFGFILDENKEKRFFHIKNIHEREKFVENLTDYFFTDWEERVCYVVTFTPSQNDKGLNALDIRLTNQIFDDRSSKIEFEAQILDLRYDTASLTRYMSGIKKGMSLPFGATAGGNGTYRIGYPEVLRELNIYFRRIDDIGWGTIDVRDIFLALNDRSKITDKAVETLKKKLVGEILYIVLVNNEWTLKDNSLLII